MRPRALVFLLVLTVADYQLWNWSIADGHDILSLVAGLTLLPLGAMSVAQLALAGTRLMGVVFGTSTARSRRHAHERALASQRMTTGSAAADASASKSDSPSSRLAA